MAIRRVALIFDREARPETTGVYCLRALEGLVDVEHVDPGDLGRLPRRGFDLYLNVDDGLDYRVPPDLHPRAWWAIDTHLDYARCRERAGDADFAFAAQRDGAEALRRDGIAATWLPLACDPEVHRPHEVPKRYDVAFVGNVFPGPREDLLHRLLRKFPLGLVAQLYFDAMAEALSATRLAFNRSLRGDVNMRVFEAVACGSLLLTDDLAANGQAEHFRDGVHLATYRDADDLLDKAAFYLERDALREAIAARGRAEAHEKHTYKHRMERLLAEVEAGASRPVAVPFAPGHAAAPDPSYYAHARPEILALVPESARAVLDVGCGAGRLGEAIKARQGGRGRGDRARPGGGSARRGAARSGDRRRRRGDAPGLPAGPVRRDRLRRRAGAPARPRRAAPPRPGLAAARRPAGRLDPQRPPPQRRRGPAAGELDLRVGRPARPGPRPVLHPPRDRETLPPRRVRAARPADRARAGLRGLAAAGRTRRGPGRPAPRRRALARGGRGVLHLPVPAGRHARGAARPRRGPRSCW